MKRALHWLGRRLQPYASNAYSYPRRVGELLERYSGATSSIGLAYQ